MRVRAIVGVKTVFKSPRVKSVHCAIAVLLILGPGSLHVTHVEYSTLVIEIAAGAIGKSIGTMVSVCRIQTVKQPNAHIGYIVSVSIFEK